MIQSKLRLSLLLLVSAALCWHCASVKPPPGGLPDNVGPLVVLISPQNGTANLEMNQEIEITFNEQVDPVSVPGSISFTPEIIFTTRVRGRRVTIRPADSSNGGFQSNTTYILTLQRGIRDYRNNNLAQPYQLVFSTGREIPIGRIQGYIAEHNPQLLMEVGLFQQVDTSFGFIRKVDLAADGTFSIDYLPDGCYRLAAVEEELNDFPAVLQRQFYALPTTDSLWIKGDTMTVTLRRSRPLARPQMISAEWKTPTYLAITFDTPFGEAPLPTSLYPTDNPLIYNHVLPAVLPSQDTILIDPGEAYSPLGETYRLEPLAIPASVSTDTTPPALAIPNRQIILETADVNTENQSDVTAGISRYEVARGRLTFSEPVRLQPGFMVQLSSKDNIDEATGNPQQILELPLRQETPLEATIDVAEPETYNTISIPGWGITDYAGNPMSDSLLSLSIQYSPPRATGSIRGRITGIHGLVVIEALESTTGHRAAFCISDSIDVSGDSSGSGYLLENVPPGFYIIFGHELLGTRPLPYYSGRWEPYHRAANFSYYFEIVEVRPRWEVDGIDINFNAGNFVPPLD